MFVQCPQDASIVKLEASLSRYKEKVESLQSRVSVWASELTMPCVGPCWSIVLGKLHCHMSTACYLQTLEVSNSGYVDRVASLEASLKAAEAWRDMLESNKSKVRPRHPGPRVYAGGDSRVSIVPAGRSNGSLWS